VVEGLDLTVMDQNGERDAGLCSGGEQQTLQIALRIALNTWITELRGSAHFETLVIDEAGNNTDDEATKRLFEQVAKVSDRFGNVCLITPKAEAARLVPNRVYIERRGVVVNVR
jgi:DNA repair exonuclease SbcCD ATPase subunit